MTYERENRDKLPELRYTIPPEDLKKINELLAPIGWSAGAIFRARNIEIHELDKKLEEVRYVAETRAREAGEYITGPHVRADPAFKAALAAYNKLFWED